LLLWKPHAMCSYTCAMMLLSTLHAHQLWEASLLQKQAPQLQGDNMKTKVPFQSAAST